MRGFSHEAWEGTMKRIFGPVFPTVAAISEKTGRNRPETQAAHMAKIEAHWDEIRAIIREELPSRDWVDGLMRRCGMPRVPADLGLTVQDTLDALTGSREIRDKYLTSSMLWDMGLLAGTAELLKRDYPWEG